MEETCNKEEHQWRAVQLVNEVEINRVSTTLHNRPGQTEARKSHAALRNCESGSRKKNYSIFFFRNELNLETQSQGNRVPKTLVSSNPHLFAAFEILKIVVRCSDVQ